MVEIDLADRVRVPNVQYAYSKDGKSQCGLIQWVHHRNRVLLPLLQCVRIGNFCCRAHTRLTLLLNVGVGSAVVVRSFVSRFVAAVVCGCCCCCCCCEAYNPSPSPASP